MQEDPKTLALQGIMDSMDNHMFAPQQPQPAAPPAGAPVEAAPAAPELDESDSAMLQDHYASLATEAPTAPPPPLDEEEDDFRVDLAVPMA